MSYRIIESTPWNIGYYWKSLIKPGLKKLDHIIDLDDEEINQIFSRILSGEAQAWVGVWEEPTDNGDINPPQPKGVMLTSIVEDTLTGSRTLVIYGLWLYERLDPVLGELGMRTVWQYAKRFGCDKVIAQTNDPVMKRYVESSGLFNKEITYHVSEV